tara:strand:- start:1305 stop:2279 length:975 start_codon:yes stop_codon:yes gene_type:complete
MNVLVTGANGFLGRHICEALRSQGHVPLAFVRRAASAQQLQKAGIDCRVGAFDDALSLQTSLKDISAIVHSAGGGKASRPASFFENNVTPTEQLLQAASQSDVKRFILISSLAAAGPSPDGTPKLNTSPLTPISPYGESKVQAEELVQQAKTRFHMGIVRPPAIYGPEDTRLLPLFRAAYKRWAPIPGGLRKTLSLIHVKDCAAAIVRTLEADYPNGTAFFVDDGAPHPVTELIELMGLAYQHRVITLGIPGWLFKPLALAGYGLSKTLGRESIITPSKIKELLCPHWVCESTQTQAILNWQPQIPLDRGIAQTCEWYQQEGWL